MIEEDHKPFSFLLHKQTSQMSKRKTKKSLYPREFPASHDFFHRLATFSKKSLTFSKNSIFLKNEKIDDFFKVIFRLGGKSRENLPIFSTLATCSSVPT
jgi:hypothetical protein